MGRICVLNAGSSTLKYAVYKTEPALRRMSGGNIDGIADHAAALAQMPVPADVMAIGHRVVHGGPDLTQPVLIDPSTMERIDAVCLSRLPVYAICTDEELVIARHTSANISIEIN